MTQRYLGGIITANPTEPSENFSDSAASGIWTMQEALSFSKAGDWPDPTSINPGKFVENLFSTFVYAGDNSTSRDISNGIDLSNKGGLVWFKERTGSQDHTLFDTERGTKRLNSNNDSAEFNDQDGLRAYNDDGFQISNGGDVNASGDNYVSWTFRKQPKFFDIVTYTGNGGSQNISHNIGSVPGCIIIKRTSSTEEWNFYHRGYTDSGNPTFGKLNSQDAFGANTSVFNNTFPTASVFTIDSNNIVNASGQTYVAYIFAHNNGDGGFGATGDQDIIKCGSYTGTGSTNPINLGFEPQWILIKNATKANTIWLMFDTIRGILTGGNDTFMYADGSAEDNAAELIELSATGFNGVGTNENTNENGQTYVYMAIRRGLMKAPTAGTDVLAILKETSANLNQDPKYLQTSGFPVDFIINKSFNASSSWWSASRMTNTRLQLESTAAESAAVSTHEFDHMNGVAVSGLTADSNFMGYMFRRAPEFFDIVAYAGTGSATTVKHNLGVTPELILIKGRNVTAEWVVFSRNDATDHLHINAGDATADEDRFFNDTAPTSSVFTVGDRAEVNGSYNYVAYLFATLAGVSKVGTYSGTGSDVNVDCGFTNGARFVLAKRTDAAGSWYIWDSARGIIAGNDPYMLTDSTAAQVTNTDYIDPLSSGFTITSNAGSDLNHNGGSYVFLAIA